MQQGVEQIVTKKGTRQGYEIVFGICSRCGEEAVRTEQPFRCGKCKTDREEDFKQNQRAIPAYKVEDVINRTVEYQCPRCKKRFDRPTPCCFVEEKIKPLKDGWQKAWFCLGCRMTYFQEVKPDECCSDAQIISGKAMVDKNGLKRRIMNSR